MKSLLFAFALFSFSGLAYAYTFTDMQGRQIQAEVLRVSGVSVTIKREDGKTFALPLTSLVKADQNYLQSWKPTSGNSFSVPIRMTGSDFEKLVTPFLKQHCNSCHDAKKAKAGFRSDQLAGDLAMPRMVDHWKEVLDRINAGEMPPEDEPRPDIKQQTAVVEWIQTKLRETELIVKNAGGQTPMRRMNRDEYANTIRDLLHLDEKFVRPLIEDLPGDGKAEGFDRLGIGLFFDQTQMERALLVAERVAAKAIVAGGPPHTEEIVWEAEKNTENPKPLVSYADLSGVKDKMVPPGPVALEKKDNGVLWTYGHELWRGKDNTSWKGMAYLSPNLDPVVKTDGYYRVRVMAGSDKGQRAEPIRIRFEYLKDTPVSTDFEIEISASLNKPAVADKMVFLRVGDDGMKHNLVPMWNPIYDLIKSNPLKDKHFSNVNGTRSKIEKAIAEKKSEAEVAALRAELAKYMADAATFEGPIEIFNPDRDPKNAPRLFVDWIKVDGPYPTAELPKKEKIAKLVIEVEEDVRNRSEGRETDKNKDEPLGRTLKPDGIEVVQGWPTYESEISNYGSIEQCKLDDLITQDGYYRVRITAKVDKRGGSEGNFLLDYAKGTPIQTRVELPVDPFGVTEHTLFLRAGEPSMKRTLRLLWTDTRNAIISEPVRDKLHIRNLRVTKDIQQGITAKQDVSALQKELEEIKNLAETLTTPERIWNPALEHNKLPVLHIDKIEVEGPIESEWPPKSHQSLFFAGNERADENYAREMFTRFLPLAYRRPIGAKEVESIVSIVRDAMQSKHMSFIEAMRHGLARVLCSPSFWFLERDPKSAPAYELASRLSYFLWSTMPDDELFALATSGKLADKAVLSAQVDRLLKDPRSAQFVRNFGGQWLGVREFGSIEPAKEYKDYDAKLKAAGAEEAYAFFTEVLSHDLPVTSFIDSDFAVLNERLAKHYGIEGVSGNEFRRVALKPENHRGGVLGMAGLLTYLADGTRTLPMRRGSWVLTNLFNDPPGNPPANAGEIQPNTAGKNLTVRERLAKHRSEETCASCHVKLDPYGLALENYDAIGAWRDRANGEGFKGKNTPVIDPSGIFPNGEAFQTLDQYKALLLGQKDKFTRCLAIKMLTYALCRPIGYTDHETIDRLVVELKKNDYRMQALVKGIVLSPAFQTK
ncbi:hypothetical protein BH11VER1_BH11VER1_07650 [soil metagenome]